MGKSDHSGSYIDYSITVLQKNIVAISCYMQTDDFRLQAIDVRKKFRKQLQELNNGYRILVEARDE